MKEIKHLRNFALIAHIDHGKSTLADRILELTGAITEREKREQYLDSMEIERERGITIKAAAVRLNYKGADGNYYIFNLIDTPGHVDFTYEVSRSLQACEGAVLLVDATQGVEAQTLANAYLALENNLEIIPVINKIDLPNADVEKTKKEIEEIIGIDSSDALEVSAKFGWNVEKLLERIVERIPPPSGEADGSLRALIFDSWFDRYLGVVVMVRIFDGRIKVGQKIILFSTGKNYEVQKLGFFTPRPKEAEEAGPGEVCFIVAGIKNPGEVKIGDTITDAERPAGTPLPGFKELKPTVFAGVYPENSDDFELLRDSLLKLRLNDSSFTFEPETSSALGFGFRCGFLGLLHMEIIQERLEREFGLNLVFTSPNVVYRVVKKNGESVEIHNPVNLPPVSEISSIEEPYAKVTIFSPSEYAGKIIEMCERRRGFQKGINYPTPRNVMIIYEMPFAELITDFFDELKSISKGYASLDYEIIGYRQGDLAKLDILVNGKPVDAFTFIVPREKAYYLGREMVKKLRELIPRQLFEVVLQAAIGSRVLARETIKPLRKNVTAKCYGGDVTRKRKLLEKQKEGKKRMKKIGHVEVPQEAFRALLRIK